jgi:phosphoglycolate phosphatase-like HAD superfamily hydrolase
MGIAEGPILESLAQMDEPRRRQAEAILLRHEEIAASRSRLNAGCREMLAWLATEKIPSAVVTRNSRLSADTVMRTHNLRIDVLITREDGPFKPSPIPLQWACRRLRLGFDQVWMVGDGQYDIEAARAAQVRSVWISHGKPRPFAAEPWLTVTGLPELTAILKQGCKP